MDSIDSKVILKNYFQLLIFLTLQLPGLATL
jgi:hypothetical protein